ncbi:MAG: exo-beta-1,3-glucanase [Methylovulum sp.]|nr:exo-beta-1,3-glucanase [Methylovulum sp.]
MRLISTVLLIVLLAAICGWLSNRPQDAGADVPQGKLNSLSFAPFWEGQGPLDAVFPSVAQLDSDLRLLSEKTRSIRTYASDEGTMPEIPALARKYGLTMIQGAWLGGIEKTNKLEVDEVIRSANANPDVVKRVIVGNEVLLRGDLEIKELIRYIRAVKQAVKQPVSYADVWSIYMKYPELMKEVDFITVHILPYWEDEPIPVDQAPGHIERIYKQIQHKAQAVAQDKPILIGESGWPSEGRQRGWAVPGVVNEAKFIRGLIGVANANGFDYNIVEAINQSWKSELEGVVGANWGLFSVDREEVFPLTGAVYEDPHWHQAWLAAIALFVGGALAGRKPLRPLPLLPLAGLLVMGQVFALLWTHQVELLWYTSYTLWQRFLTLLTVGLNAALAGLMLQYAYVLLAKQLVSEKFAGWFYQLYLGFGGFALFKTLYLAINGRYISFPLLTMAIAVTGMVALMLIGIATQRNEGSGIALLPDSKRHPQEKWLGYALLAAGLALIIGEAVEFFQSRDLILAYPGWGGRLALSLRFTLTNRQLAQWLMCLLVLAAPLCFIKGKNKAVIG